MFQAPGFLAKLNDIPTDMTLEGMEQFRRLQGADQLLQDTNQQAYDMTAEQRPYRLAQLDMANQTAKAQLPGIAAQADLTRTQAEQGRLNLEEQRALQLPKMESMLAKYGYEKTRAYLDQVAAMGPLMRSAAEQVWSNPVGGRLAAREMFEKAGQGSMWSPAWDNLPPDQLAMALFNHGRAIQESSDKYTQALDTQDAKARANAAVTAMRLQSAEKQTNARIASAQQLQKSLLTEQAKWKTTDFSQAGVLYTRWSREEQEAAQAAADAGKMEQARMHMQKAQEYSEEASRMEQRAYQKASAGAATGNEAKVDVPAVVNQGAFQSVEPKGGPTAVVPQPAVKAPQGVAPPAAKPAAAPTDRVRVKRPDGTVGTIPKNQLADALKEGYTEVK